MVTKGKNQDHSRAGTAVAGRRAVLRLGIAALVTTTAGPAFAAPAGSSARMLALRHLHTEETVRATYWADGAWQVDGLREISHVLRDFRTGDVVDMDPDLLDLMHRLAALVGANQPFEVYSGYRSPRTNAKLADQSSGVARKSMHMLGRAADLRLPGVNLSSLRRAALSLQEGGVGYYPRSGFIHVDTGPVRFW
jgi:uncharacterized protein YcbK (DUF882 family)